MTGSAPAVGGLALTRGEVEWSEHPARAGMEAAAPLVLLHEGLGCLELWRGFPAALAAATGRRTVAWSRPGYGRSSPVRGPWPPSYMHDEATTGLPELLDRVAAERPVLVGHSDGASIALIHAGAGRRPVTGLVVIAPHVLVEAAGLASIRRARQRYLAGGLRERMARYHRDPDATFFGWCDAWLAPGFGTWNIEGDLPAIRSPVLALQAADDEYGSLDQLDRIAAGVSGPFRRVVLPDGGHSPHLTHEADVVAALAGFVAPLC